MAINLASKYSDQIAEVFTRASFIKGKTAETYDLTGVKTLKVYTPITVEEVDYDRDGGLKRYGDVTEMQDVVQELTMTQARRLPLPSTRATTSIRIWSRMPPTCCACS